MKTKEQAIIPEQEQIVSDAENEVENLKQKKSKKQPSKLSTKLKLIILLSAVLVTAILFTLFAGNNDKSKLTIVSQSSLQEVIEIDQLSTVEYIYNAIATKNDKDKNPMYYVAYEGKVTAGIDFSKIGIDIFEEEQKIVLSVPEVTIHATTVNMGTMEYIFTKNKYETETISQEAYKLCLSDLKDRINTDNTLFKTAKETAISTVEGLFKPWIDTLDGNYTIEIKYGDEEK